MAVRALRLAYKLWFGLVFFMSLLVLYSPSASCLTEHRYRRAFRLKRAWAFFLQWASGVPVKVESVGPATTALRIDLCNHGSYPTSSRCTTWCRSTSSSWASTSC